ncbi:MAG: hypothetical protein ACTSSJ_03780 [Candidatus Odinarchaeia archaeon]
MVNIDNLESVANKVMDDIPEIEGLIFIDKDGKVLAGHTITEMNHNEIAEMTFKTLKDAISLSESMDKGALEVFYAGYENGYIIAIYSKEASLVGIIGKDATASLGLIIRSLKTALKSVIGE